MRISHFFIDRPIFACVLSIVFVILGAVAYARLPVAQYPEIAPPIINVTGQYPGASADIVASTVVAPIEEQINGVENMLYMSSNSTADGRFSIAVSFDLGTNLDIAQVQVQNRVAIAQPRLPADVRLVGVTVTKSSPDLMLVVHLYSPDKSRDALFISNYATLEIRTRSPASRGRVHHGVRQPGLRHARLARSGSPAVARVDRRRCDARDAGSANRLLRACSTSHPSIDRGFQVAVKTRASGRSRGIRLDRREAIGGCGRTPARRRQIELAALDYSSSSYLNVEPAVALAVFQRPARTRCPPRSDPSNHDNCRSVFRPD
jgi:hypothetical protein